MAAPNSEIHVRGLHEAGAFYPVDSLKDQALNKVKGSPLSSRKRR
ncbi:hypothetical protein AVEN_222010-1, partial [Araneus ventricosus]